MISHIPISNYRHFSCVDLLEVTRFDLLHQLFKYFCCSSVYTEIDKYVFIDFTIIVFYLTNVLLDVVGLLAVDVSSVVKVFGKMFCILFPLPNEAKRNDEMV